MPVMVSAGHYSVIRYKTEGPIAWPLCNITGIAIVMLLGVSGRIFGLGTDLSSVYYIDLAYQKALIYTSITSLAVWLARFNYTTQVE